MENPEPEQTFSKLAIQVSSLTGVAYFNSFLKAFSQLLEADIAIVAEIISEGAQARTVSVCMDGETADNFEFDLNGSPFSSCRTGQATIYPEEVTALFPNDYLLSDLSVEGFAAIPLVNPQQKATGFLAVMFHSAIVNQQIIEPAFGAFTARVAAELEQKRKFNKLSEIESYFLGITKLTKDVILVLSLRGEIRFASDSAIALFGFKPDALTDPFFYDFMTEDTRLLGKQEYEKFVASGETQFNIDLKVARNESTVTLWAVKTITGNDVTGCVVVIERRNLEAR